MDDSPRSSSNVPSPWVLLLVALLFRPILAAGAVAAIAITPLVLMEVVMPISRAALTMLPDADELTGAVAYRTVILLVACAVCLIATMAAAAMAESVCGMREGEPWSPRLLRRSALIWLVVLAAPYLYGLPWRLVVWTEAVTCCKTPIGSMVLSIQLLCWVTLKAGLASALLVGLPDAVEGERRRRTFAQGRDLFAICLLLFVALTIPQAAIDFAYWNTLEDNWKLVSSLAVIGDAVAALLATFMAFAVRWRLEAETSPEIFE